MASEPRKLTLEEFASLLTPVNEPPAKISAEHSARLTALGYMVDLSVRLRMTAPGRRRIAAGRVRGQREAHRLRRTGQRDARRTERTKHEWRSLDSAAEE